MRTILVAASISASFLFAACGGGGSSGGASSAVAGTVVVRDGSTSNLGGVRIGCVESGSSDVTDADGKFRVVVESGTVIHLDVDDPNATGAGEGGDCTESDDDTPDATDIKGGEIEVGKLDDGESCEIEIEIEDGVVVGIHVSKHDGKGGSEDSGEGVLLPPEKGDAFGEIEVDAEHGCLRLELETKGLLPGGAYDVSLIGKEGGATLLGHFTVGDKGEGRLVFEACAADLPLEVPTPTDLAGATIVVQNVDGVVVLSGAFPTAGCEKKDGDAKDGDEKDGEEKDGEEKDGEEPDGEIK